MLVKVQVGLAETRQKTGKDFGGELFWGETEEMEEKLRFEMCGEFFPSPP